MPGHEFNMDMNDEQAFKQGVHELGELFGLKGFDVIIQPGAGWQCIKSPRGITMVVDPVQLAERYQPEQAEGMPEQAGQGGETDSRYTLYAAAHELGHGNDYADPEWVDVKRGPSEDFFWNVVDDTVINTRLRRVPMLDSVTDDIYGKVLFPTDDLTEAPKHVQLMYGMLLGTVTNNPLPKVDPQVKEKLDELTSHEANGQVFDIFQTLADPRTTLRERRAIANHFVMPAYKELLEQDQQEQEQQQAEDGEQGDQGDQGNQNGEQGFQDQYQQYEDAMHGEGEPHEHDPGEQQQQSGQSGEGNDREDGDAGEQDAGDGDGEDDEHDHSHARQIAEILKAQAKEEAEQKSKQDSNDASPGDTHSSAVKGETDTNEADHQEALGNLAGAVAGEMNLNPGDAKKYVESLDEWSDTIRDTAAVFLKLAAPTTATMSPRYDSQAMTEGIRLHPRNLAKAALQLETDGGQAIWQQIERRANQQRVAFGGLDIHLLVDVSVSMSENGKAARAAACSQILLEGVQLARHQVMQAGSQLEQPDVRTQVVAFGAGTEVLAPLTLQPTGPQKGAVFSNLLRPNSGNTLVSGALSHVQEAAAKYPERESIAVIISDGIFGDFEAAKKLVESLPEQAYVAHLVIGRDVEEFISPHNEVITNPASLPASLYKTLASRIQTMQMAA